jgi:hypothetical protein
LKESTKYPEMLSETSKGCQEKASVLPSLSVFFTIARVIFKQQSLDQVIPLHILLCISRALAINPPHIHMRAL